MQASYLIKVLDRSDDKFKLLEVGPQIFKGIQMLSSNQKWGKVTSYDISIIKGPKGTQPLYNVTPNPKEALHGSFQGKFTEFNDSLNLDKITSPLPDQEILKLLGWDDEPAPRARAQTSAAQTQARPQQSANAGGGGGKTNEAFEFDFDNE
jgi:hypothetical protein